jgi:hypothetical protein
MAFTFQPALAVQGSRRPSSRDTFRAFHFFGGTPRRITYDNLKTAVYRILRGHNRQEQEAFVAFRPGQDLRQLLPV